jgi:hypothetical protein
VTGGFAPADKRLAMRALERIAREVRVRVRARALMCGGEQHHVALCSLNDDAAHF